MNDFATGGSLPPTPVELSWEEGGGWVRALMAEYGDVLFDFSGDRLPGHEGTQNGNPRLVLHAPDGGDAIVFIQLNRNELTMIPEAGVHVELTADGKVRFHY